jgi:hypothetical protein
MFDFVATNIASQMIAPSAHSSARIAPALDWIALLGFLSAFFTLAIWPTRHKTVQSQIAFCTGLLALSLYCFLAGIWPMGAVGIVWTVIAVRETFPRRKPLTRAVIRVNRVAHLSAESWNTESRLTRMFGPNRG